jgi:protein gp37
MTTIEWTDETWNPVTGCDKISPGCKHCYAKALHDMRHQAFLNGVKMPEQYSVPFETVKCWEKRLDIPLHWRAPRMCFINSMADLFHEDVPFEFISQALATVCLTPHITYQSLTKRADRMLDFFQWVVTAAIPRRSLRVGIQHGPLLNFWPGVSIESEKYLYRLDLLRQVPAAVRMVSFEPLLEDLGEVNLQGIGWAIVGGESGRGARPCHPDWVRSLRDQCVAQGVPFFFKQWGEWAPAITAKRGADAYFMRAGKKNAGALLDSREWREFPKPYPGHEVIRLKRKAVAA